MNFETLMGGIYWRIKNPSNGPFSWPPLLSYATTIGHTTVFQGNICPDVISLGHEFFHVQHTNTLRYIFSFTIGRLWKDSYWRDQEAGANANGLAVQKDVAFVALAARIRGMIPASIPTVVVNHPV